SRSSSDLCAPGPLQKADRLPPVNLSRPDFSAREDSVPVRGNLQPFDSCPTSKSHFYLSCLGRIYSHAIFHNLAAFHHKAHAFQLPDIACRVTVNSDDICELARLDRAYPVLPSQHFRGIYRHGANDVDRRHAGLTQISKDVSGRLASSF